MRPARPERVDERGLDLLLAEFAGNRCFAPGEAFELIGAVLDRIEVSEVERRLVRSQALLDLAEAAPAAH